MTIVVVTDGDDDDGDGDGGWSPGGAWAWFIGCCATRNAARSDSATAGKSYGLVCLSIIHILCPCIYIVPSACMFISFPSTVTGMLNLLKFFAASEEHLLPKCNIFLIAIEASLQLISVAFS